MSFVEVISGPSFEKEQKAAIKEIWDKVDLLVDDDALFLNSADKSYNLTSLSEKIQCMPFDNNVSRLFVDIIASQGIEMFRAAPFLVEFGAWYTIKMLSSPSLEEIETSWQSKPARKRDVLKFIEKASRCKLTTAAIEEAFDSTGLSGKFFIEDSRLDRSTIEVKMPTLLM